MKSLSTFTLILIGLSAVEAQMMVRPTQPTRLNIALVTFADADEMPHGYTRTVDEVTGIHTLTPGTESYRMIDFQRKFGATGTDFGNSEGPDVPLSNGETLRATYGSLRNYFFEISREGFDFDVRIVNREDPNHTGYPEWIILQQTRATFDTVSIDQRGIFLPTVLPQINHYINTHHRPTDPNSWATFPTRVQDVTDDVVAIIYGGWETHNRMNLHPHARRRGACYVTGERQGNGRGPRDYDGDPSTPPTADVSETFTGIGIHAHEMGHLLGFRHPQGGFPNNVTHDINVYPDPDQVPTVTTYERTNPDGTTETDTLAGWPAGSIAAWCAMHNGDDGPPSSGRLAQERGGFHLRIRFVPSPLQCLLHARTPKTTGVECPHKSHQRDQREPADQYVSRRLLSDRRSGGTTTHARTAGCRQLRQIQYLVPI